LPVSDPEKILRPRGLFKQNVVVYQSKSNQSKDNIFFKPSPSRELPLRKILDSVVEAETLKSKQLLPEIKTETSLTTSYITRGDTPALKLIPIDIPSTLNMKSSVTQGLEEVSTYTDSTPVGSPIYISCKSEDPSPCIPSSPFSNFTSSSKKFPEFSPFHPKEARESLYIFTNPLYNAMISSPRLSMAAAGGGAGGIGGQGQQPPPIVFTKVAARYTPLVLPVPLHDLPKRYMKKLPKFTGEGDLTTTEHINFFDQFVDILGLEHEDVYSRLFVHVNSNLVQCLL
jgi:hypothetical protein